MNKEEVLKIIDNIQKDLNNCQNQILHGRLTDNQAEENLGLFKLESVVIGIQQDLTVIKDYLNETD